VKHKTENAWPNTE